MIGAALVLAIGALSAVVYVRATGLNARPAPGTLETRVMRRLRVLAMPGAIRTRASSYAAAAVATPSAQATDAPGPMNATPTTAGTTGLMGRGCRIRRADR